MKYCACETPGHSHLCGTVTGCPEECTWTPWDRIQKFQQGSCLKGHRKISRQTSALFLGSGYVPLYLIPPLPPSSSHTRIHTNTRTPTGPMLCSVSLVMRQIWTCRETDGDSFKENMRMVSEGWERGSQLAQSFVATHFACLVPSAFKESVKQKIQASVLLWHILYLFYRRSKRRKEWAVKYILWAHISRLLS